MDETPASSALQYGHLGKAIYHPESRSWAFSRALAQPSFIRYTGITNTTIPSPLRALRSSRPECKTTLPLIHPEVAACLPFANEDLSRAVTATSEICDPRVSSLFDIGRAVELDSSGSSEGFIHIGVVATGECCNSISFRVLEEDSVNLTCLGLQAPAQLRVPCVGDAENTEWSTGGAPIRQVCCARTLEETPTWVAARFPRSTVVFHPLYHRNRVPMHVSRGENYTAPSKARNSRLNANPLVEIANSQTGGFAHADVTFNPWYQKQLGIVDERGNWSVWEISGLQRLNKSTWSTACIRSGSLPWLDIGGGSDGRSTDRLRFDGWGAIEWTGDVNSFVVADRRCLILYRMEGDRIWPYTIELGLDKKSEWILDIKRSHCDVSHVFILTTSRVLFVDVGPVIMSPNEQDKRSSLTPRLSWHHFRDPGDTTMLLSPILVDEGMYLIIYSRLNSFVLAFQCRLSAEGQIDMIHAPDPFILDVPRPSDNPAVWQVPRSDPHFSTLAFQEVGPSLKAAAKRHYYPNIRLLKLFLLDSSLALRESIYVGPLAKSNDEEQLSGRDVLRLKTRNPTRQKRELARHESDFVVDDWDESVFGMDTLMAHSVCPTGALPTIPDWVVDHTQTYAVATGEMGTITSGGGDNEHERSFRESIEDLNEKFSVAALSDRHTSSTIFELLGKTPSLGDIDQNAQDLQQLLDPQDSVLENGYQLLVLPSNLSSSSSTSSARSVELSSTLDLVSTYDRLVNDWLSVLPHTIPGRTRIMKEKVIRGVAVDLNLARVNVTASSSEDSSGPRHGMLTEDSDQADADFSEVGTPGGLEGGGSDSHQYANAMAQNYSSLSSLTTFNGQKPMARSIATMLAHWQPGTTPAAYGWQQTVQDQESESETATRRRPRRSRSRMKLSQSQTPGIGSSTPSAMSSGLPPAQNWGSQPDGANLVKFESSQTVEDDLPMTQVERGTFGGREAARSRAIKARKKRAAGF